jgi:hypothetical protein
MKVLDEVHHITSRGDQKSEKGFLKVLDIASSKQLSLTATLKQVESICDNSVVVSTVNVVFFGEIIFSTKRNGMI